MIASNIRTLSLLFISLSSDTTNGQSTDQTIIYGEEIYAVTCATGYCHTLKGGAGGGAPRLAARDFDLDYITRTIPFGLNETKMEGFSSRLPENDLAAVIAYVADLNGISTDGVSLTPAAMQTKPRLSADALLGKNLFHDSPRAFDRCATCHQVEGSGVPAAEPITVIPVTAAFLRQISTSKVSTISIAGDTMPALVLSNGAARSVFFDLTSSPPVRRNVESSGITISEGSDWSHAAVIHAYSDMELEYILAYLRTVVK